MDWDLTYSTPLAIIQPVVSIIFYNIMLFDEKMTFTKIVFEHTMKFFGKCCFKYDFKQHTIMPYLVESLWNITEQHDRTF
jgi:hypothetical protein